MDLFYARPLERAKGDDEIRYYKQPVGRNKLSKMVSEMCTFAKFLVIIQITASVPQELLCFIQRAFRKR